ncbi:MAG: pilus assembly protein PilM [Verrucomicrobiia bacterium]
MASSQRILCIDVGSTNLKVGEFAVDGRNVTLLKYRIQDLGLDPNKEQERFPFILEGIQTAMGALGSKPAPVYCSLLGSNVFVKFIKLPPVTPDQIDQMVGFEAQQNVPFPIDEVVWDYQLVGGGNGREYEVALTAIKGEFVEEMGTALGTCKLLPKVFDVGIFALVNAFRYHHAGEGCNLLIDIGAKTTNLVFIDGKKVFCRSIQIAGVEITQKISNEFGEPYAAAETLKRGKGYVGLGGAYADPPDEHAARISKIARNTFTRLHAEVTRSIAFFRNQQGGSTPQAVYITGGTAAMPYADLFFKEKLSVPVQRFNPLENIGIGPEVDPGAVSSDLVYFGPLVGLALRAQGDCPIEVNLIPKSVKIKQSQKARAPLLVVSLLCVAGAFGLLGGSAFVRAQQIKSDTAQLEAALANRESISRRIQAVETELNAAVARAVLLERLAAQRAFWPILLSALSEKVPVGVWVTQMNLQANGGPIDVPVVTAPPPPPGPARGPARGPQGGQPPPAPEVLNLAPEANELLLRGYVESAVQEADPGVLNRFEQGLLASGLFEEVKIADNESPDGDAIALRFTIRAKLKPEAALDLKP